MYCTCNCHKVLVSVERASCKPATFFLQVVWYNPLSRSYWMGRFHNSVNTSSSTFTTFILISHHTHTLFVHCTCNCHKVLVSVECTQRHPSPPVLPGWFLFSALLQIQRQRPKPSGSLCLSAVNLASQHPLARKARQPVLPFWESRLTLLVRNWGSQSTSSPAGSHPVPLGELAVSHYLWQASWSMPQQWWGRAVHSCVA